MRPPFRLNKTIGEAYDMDLADTLITKQTLASLGHLEVPDGGFDPYPDRPMIEAVKSFQRAEGLTEDGVMKPDGPTLARLNEALENEPAPAPPNNRQDTSATSLLGPAPEPTSPLSRHLASLPARPGAVPPMDSKKSAPEGTQVAMAPAVAALLLPSLGAAARALFGQTTRSIIGGATTGAAGALIANQAKPDEQDTANERTEISPTFPPSPGYEPSDIHLPNLTEPADKPIELPDLSQPIPETTKPTIFISPIPSSGEFGPNIWESKGNERTRKHLEHVRDWFLKNNAGWTHLAGGRDQASGSEMTEYYIPGTGFAFPHPGKRPGEAGDGRAGSKRTDLTFVSPDGKTFVHIQTVDVDRNGKPTDRELDNAEKARRGLEARQQEEEIHHILLVGKDWMMPKRVR